jgi:titin
VSGQPEPTVEWMKDGEVLTSSQQMRPYYDGEVCRLTIFETKESDGGEYTCVATNENGTASSKARLVVTEPVVIPEFKKKLESTTAVEEKTAEFVVRVVGYPEPTIEWMKGGKKIRSDGRFHAKTTDKHTYKLIIKNVTLEDLGTYKCVASNEAGRVQCSARLEVTEKMIPPKIISELPERTMLLNEGDDLQLHTTVEGNPIPDVEWYKDGSIIRRTARINVSPLGNKYSLTVRELVAEDTGVFKCVAKSGAGTFSKSFTVVVECEYKYFAVFSSHIVLSAYLNGEIWILIIIMQYFRLVVFL